MPTRSSRTDAPMGLPRKLSPEWRGVVLSRTTTRNSTNSTVGVPFEVALVDTEGGASWNVNDPTKLKIPPGITKAQFFWFPALSNASTNYYRQLSKNGQAVIVAWDGSMVEGGPAETSRVFHNLVPTDYFDFATYTAATVQMNVVDGTRPGRLYFGAQFWP